MEEPRTAPEPTTQEAKDKIEIEVESKHIVICKVLLASELKKKKKTNRYVVFTGYHAILAEIYWNGPWRQYCFYPEPQCIWSTSCLDTIVEFIKKINTEHRGRLSKV